MVQVPKIELNAQLNMNRPQIYRFLYQPLSRTMPYILQGIPCTGVLVDKNELGKTGMEKK